MDYDKKYFESGRAAFIGKLSFFLKFLPHALVKRSSQKHLELYLKSRWAPFIKCEKVLDLGCGEGEFIKLNPFNIQVKGAEVSDKLVKNLKKEKIDISLERIDEKLTYKDNSFDGVACFHVLEHIQNYIDEIKEIKRVLKNKGVLVIAVPSLNKFYDDYTHVKPFTKKSLQRVLQDNDFEDVKITKGISQSRIISAIFFFVPSFRFILEKLFGKISPFEIVAVCKNRK